MKSTLTGRKFALALLVALSVAAPPTIGLFAESRPSQQETERATVENETIFPGHAPLQPATFSWREILKRRPSSVCRVRFQIESTATSADDQLLLAGGNCGFDAIILEPSQPSEKESRERFEVAIVGDARVAAQRLGLSSSDFRDQWIEVTGFPRHFSESRADGDVAVSQFVVSDIESLEIHSTNWQGNTRTQPHRILGPEEDDTAEGGTGTSDELRRGPVNQQDNPDPFRIGVILKAADVRRIPTYFAGGFEVTKVVPDSPAQRAGIEVGDVLLAWEGNHFYGKVPGPKLLVSAAATRELRQAVERVQQAPPAHDHFTMRFAVLDHRSGEVVEVSTAWGLANGSNKAHGLRVIRERKNERR